LALLGGDVQRRVHVLGGGVDGGAVLQQQHHNVHVAEARRDVQGRLVLLKHTQLTQLDTKIIKN